MGTTRWRQKPSRLNARRGFLGADGFSVGRLAGAGGFCRGARPPRRPRREGYFFLTPCLHLSFPLPPPPTLAPLPTSPPHPPPASPRPSPVLPPRHSSLFASTPIFCPPQHYPTSLPSSRNFRSANHRSLKDAIPLMGSAREDRSRAYRTSMGPPPCRGGSSSLAACWSKPA